MYQQNLRHLNFDPYPIPTWTGPRGTLVSYSCNNAHVLIFMPPELNSGVSCFCFVRCLSICLFFCDSVAKKTLNLGLTFDQFQVGLSYFTCAFLMMHPFHPYQMFWPIDHDLWSTYPKYFTSAIAFEPLTFEVGLWYFTFHIPCDKAFPFRLNFLT